MKKILFAGCSYVSGCGFDLEKNEPSLWVNLLHQHTEFKLCKLVNCGTGGRSNQGIFLDSVHHLSQGDYEYAIVAWTSMPRYELELGLETYVTKAVFMPNSPLRDYNLNGITYSKAYLKTIRDRFVTLAHLHFEILNLIYYVNSLIRLANLVNTKIFFVNSLCPWDRDYFNCMHSVLPEKYTEFTKKLINVNNRDDEEIFKIYNKMHKQYKDAGSIQEKHWLNLYNSLGDTRVDVNNDGLHPGIKSNQLYFETLTQAING